MALASAFLFLAPPAPALAQQLDARGVAAVKVYDWCMRLPTGSVSECSCVSGFFAGATEEDEYEVIAAFVDFIGADGGISDEDGLRAAIAAYQERSGMSDERLDVLLERFATFDALGQKADAICLSIKKVQTPASVPE